MPDGYSPPLTISAALELGDIAISACMRCGAAIFHDPDDSDELELELPARDPNDVRPAIYRVHDAWHDEHDR